MLVAISEPINQDSTLCFPLCRAGTEFWIPMPGNPRVHQTLRLCQGCMALGRFLSDQSSSVPGAVYRSIGHYYQLSEPWPSIRRPGQDTLLANRYSPVRDLCGCVGSGGTLRLAIHMQ